MITVIFDDSDDINFYPHTLMRPQWALRFGAFEMHERITLLLKGKTDRVCLLSDKKRYAYLRTIYGESVVDEIPHDDDILFVNSLCTDLSAIDLTATASFFCKGRLAAAFVKKGNLAEIVVTNGRVDGLKDLPKKEITVPLFPSYLWDLPLLNGEMLKTDFSLFSPAEGELPFAVSGDRRLIHLGKGVSIEPFVSFSTEKGPVIVENGVSITSFSRIEGPCYIGKNCQIFRANIREGCSFGADCRLGGEIEDSIFHSFSNKYHDGFIGHAYVGSWVNLGAMTTNSDLKNDYSDVIMSLPGKTISSGSPKVGALIGDFVRCSIGTLINTGGIIGTGSMTVFSGRMTPPHLPAFAVYLKNKIRDIKSFDSLISTIATQMKRRKCNFSGELESLLRDIVIDTSGTRQEESEVWNRKMN